MLVCGLAADPITFVRELKPDSGVLKRGSVLSAVAADGGKLTLTTAGSEATAFGVLLDPAIDTADKCSNNLVTGSVARSGSFKGQALIVGVGTNIVTLTDALRKNDIFVEGPIVAPVAATQEEPNVTQTEKPAPTAFEA